ncbi:MAG: hypothetical protein LBV38_05085 [Alistipes sp.]|jgi:hypothetical protein|nr:hypothetical protein [Alistipes sp.]
MTTIVINDDSPQGRLLVNMMREAKKSSNAIVSIEGDVAAAERIPGLPYTHEERVASVRKGVEDYKAGRVIGIDELKGRMERW